MTSCDDIEQQKMQFSLLSILHFPFFVFICMEFFYRGPQYVQTKEWIVWNLFLKFMYYFISKKIDYNP